MPRSPHQRANERRTSDRSIDELREAYDDGTVQERPSAQGLIDDAADEASDGQGRLIVSGVTMLVCAVGLAVLAYVLFRGASAEDLVDIDGNGREVLDVRGWLGLGAAASITVAGVLGYGAAASLRRALGG